MSDRRLLMALGLITLMWPTKAHGECLAFMGGEVFVDGAYSTGLNVVSEDGLIVALGADAKIP